MSETWPTSQENTSSESRESRKEREMDELELYPEEWEIYDIIRDIDQEDPVQIEAALKEVREIIRAKYAEYNQEDLVDLIMKEAEQRLADMLILKRKAEQTR